MASPNTCWLLLRSLETLKVRMEAQSNNAKAIADFLFAHDGIENVKYLGLLDIDSEDYKIYQKQYSAPRCNDLPLYKRW